jgi:hypothetical protein
MMRGDYEHLPETDEALVYACMALMLERLARGAA